MQISPETTAPTYRLPALDGIRAVSILLVLAAHMLPLGPKQLQLNHAAGGMGMSLFFALSGFLIAATVLRDSDVIDFLIRRFARIVPLAYAYTLVVCTVITFNPEAMFWTATFLVNYFPQYMIEGYTNHFWSLCVEVHFYLAVALILVTVGSKGIWVVWPACLLVTGMRISEGAFYSIYTHLRVDEILAGACLATIYHRGLLRGWGSSSLLLGLAIALFFISSSPYGGWMQYFRCYLTGLVMAVVLSRDSGPVFVVLASRPMRYIARVSYALYVIHPITIQGWWNEGDPVARYLLKRPVSIAITFALAHLSTFHWEAYWMRIGKEWIQQRKLRSVSSE